LNGTTDISVQFSPVTTLIASRRMYTHVHILCRLTVTVPITHNFVQPQLHEPD